MMVDESKGQIGAEAPAGELPPEVEVERGGFSLWERLRSPRTLISFAMALAIVIFLLRGLNIDLATTWGYIRQANPWLLLLGLGVFYLTFPLRAVRWRMLLRNADVPVDEGRHTWASLPALMEYLYLSWFANCIVPAKLGDAYRGYLLKRNGGVSFSTAFGTIFAERLLDMIGLFGMLVLSAWFTFGARMPEGTQIVFAFGGLLVVAILGGLAGMRWLSPLIRRIIPLRFLGFYIRFESAALKSFSPAILPRLVLLTAGVWLLEGFRLFFVIEALGPEMATLSLSAIVFVALASSLLTALPITPAGLGVVEGTITVVLTLFGVDKHLGIAVTFLDRLINFWSIVVGGLIVYLLSKRK
jgi:uncharacterized membrane protein YbhN (UPF0104 family)